MRDDSTNAPRLDRRLAGRRGWIDADELARAIERLPDVAEKGELIDAPTAAGEREESSPQGD